jgi:hypothetical protein
MQVDKMTRVIPENQLERLATNTSFFWKEREERAQVAKTIQALDARYALSRKMVLEPGVADIIQQMAGRLAISFRRLGELQNKRILDIACGSNTSRLPASLYFDTLSAEIAPGKDGSSYTALFEPWFCRMLYELGAAPVGVDVGDLEQELFTHLKVNLGKPGALDFLPEASFDAIQDSRLFGSPEFTAQFPRPADRLKVAQEIVQQEYRLLKRGGKIIHSDAAALLR